MKCDTCGQAVKLGGGSGATKYYIPAEAEHLRTLLNQARELFKKHNTYYADTLEYNDEVEAWMERLATSDIGQLEKVDQWSRREGKEL